MAGSVIELVKIWQEIVLWEKSELSKAEFYRDLPTPLLALALSLFDMETDFNLAFQVPVECGLLDWNYTEGNLAEARAWLKERLDNPCTTINGDHNMCILQESSRVEETLRRFPSPPDPVPHLLCHLPLWSPHGAQSLAKFISLPWRAMLSIHWQ